MAVDRSSEILILCIDDDHDILNLLERILAADNYTVITAADGRQGLDLARSRRPDLILLDVVMPEIDGYEVCRMLKDDNDTVNIPIIFITAKNENEDEYTGLKMGAVDYIRKPFYPPIVKARVKTQADLKLKTDLLESLAAIDGLTNISNRRKFDEMIAIEWKRAVRGNYPLSLIMIDVDFFKQYNDNYGHAAGDDCLRRIAQGLRNMLLRPSDLPCRYGGEEFAVILPETDFRGATDVSAKLVEGIGKLNIPHEHSPAAGHVTISAGATTSIPGNNCETPRQLLEMADSMLYLAKQKGRNRFQGNDLSTSTCMDNPSERG
jgi:diguanylate cyclase (GGDEF)-like protein